MKVLAYKLYSENGKIIRTATKVILDNGREIKFIERLSKGQAIGQVLEMLKKEPANV